MKGVRKGLSVLCVASLGAAGIGDRAGAAPPAGTTVLEAAAMDLSADPGKDFYRYANGAWIQGNPVPSDRSHWGEYEEVADRTQSRLRTLAEQASAAPGPDGSASQMVGDFFRSGMAEAAVEAAGARPIAPYLEAIAAVRTREDLADVLIRFHAAGLGGVFSLSVGQDAKNSDRYILDLQQGGLGLPEREYYLKNDAATRRTRDAYLRHVARMLALLGESEAEAAAHARSVLRLETRLARAHWDKVALRDPVRVYHLMTLRQLDALSPGGLWPRFFAGIGLPAPGDINVGEPEFFRAAGRLLKGEPLDVWKSYLRWHLADGAAPYLSKAFVDENFSFSGHVLSGAAELKPRWKRVVDTLDGAIGDALGRLYAERYFPPEAKAKAVSMVANIRAAMRENLAGLAWMSPETRAKAVEKLDRMRVKIGYPDQWRDYSALKIRPDDYWGNVAAAAQFEFRRALGKLGRPVDRTEWGMTVPTVNAYYDPSMNEMAFPAGILQAPLFDPDADEASNYGNTGATIGHEMTHGFDDEGRKFDGDGNLRDWWTPADAGRFVERSRRIERQFDAFVPLDGVHINGKLTAGENIADLGGLKLAWRALEKALSAPGARPGLIEGLTPEQRFFVAYAQSFRENQRPEQLRLQLATDPHAPGRYRVLGPIANMPEFTEAFHLPADRSPVRPESERVEIW